MVRMKSVRRAGDKAERLARIAREITSCEQCRCESLGKAVAGDGNPDARLVFVGEAPGKRESASGHAFQGRAGKFLRQALRRAGVDEDEMLFLNALKYMPMCGVPTARAIRHGRLHLLDQLAAVEPDAVVLMGSTAIRTVFDRHISVLNEHGRVAMRAGDRVRFFFTLHPSAAVRFPAMRKLFLRDLRRLSGMLKDDKRKGEQHQRSCNLDKYRQEVACPHR
jgi:uracil-DNA glycosylase